jgi:uncharacterized protein YaaW (UPF0174 family)
MSRQSNIELIDYLNLCESDTIFALLGTLDSIFLQENKFAKFKNISDIPAKSSEDRNLLARDIVYLLRYFGSHNVSYIWRMVFSNDPGVDYSEILYDVTKLLSKQVKRTVPRVATVPEYEQLLCESLLQIQFKGKTEQEIAEMLEEAGLEKENIEDALKQFAKFGLSGVGIISLVRILGKKTVTEMIERMIVWLIAKRMGREAAEKAAQRLLKSAAQKTIAKLVSGVGWVLIAWDIVNLGSPATRKTVPIVSLIASMRTMDRFK